MACRYPGGADTPEKFWQVFKEGRDTISEVPPERWDLSAFYDPDKSAPGKMYTRYGGFIENVALFDPQFFGISPREAVDMDPQQRIALEVSWEAMENAGIVPASLAGSNTAVFMGICFNDYGQLITESGNPEGVDDYYSTGNHYSVLAGRISYFFGLEGPAMAIDTACSSSLVAIDRAVKQLQSRESDLAISGGVNLILVPQSTINFCKSGMLAQDGRCKTFDAAADGYVRSEGCGVVLLKRWSDAQRDGNRILAVIRATAINQDGASAGLTVPNERAQEKLIEDALKRAKLQGSDIDYVEAHGTGTALGDPIEVRAIAATYGARRESPLWLASAKTNIGHTEAAAGVAGLMKCILALQHEQIPTHLHFHQLNPLIPLDENSIQVARDGRVWKRGPRRRIAAVSSFGFSGTNSHAIVEEGPLLKSTEVDSEDHVLLISAKTEPALNDLISAYQAYLANTAHHIADIVYSANFGRTHFEHRVVVRGRTKEELVKKLLNRNFEPSETELPKMAARQWVTLPNYPFQRKHYWVQTHSKRVETIATGEFGRELAASSDKLKTATEYVTKQVKLILDIDPNETIDPTKGFIEMGMDSLMAVKLAENLRRSLGGSVRIKETVVFDYQSVNKLAAYLTSGEIQEVQRSEVSFQNEPIAIIGIACRFPGGVEDPEAFWDFLHNGVDGISEVPRERWDIDAFYDPDPNAPGKMITRKGGFIKDPAFFDAEFFGISPREAEAMDPQQRLLLETTWEGLERAGIAPSSLKDSPTGVFVGACFSDYTQLIESSDFRQFKSHSALGLARNALNGRISYALGLLGPSMTVDTACSSSLVSTHLACQSLQRGECTVAIAAGANLMLSPAPFVMLSKARMLAPDGHCKTFDKSGDGYARGEGVGVIILKRLSDAVRDGDPILAVIRATAVNQDGASGGITVPNGVAQVRLIRQALNQAQFQPTDVSFVEAHGTGTELGDPIEIGAIEDSYGKGRTGDYPLFLGSVKSNIGHLEGAAGIASIIKVVLALTHGILPPNIGPKELNPKIHLDRIPARVVMEPTPWTGLRRAGVSSFGFTGTNAHAIIEEAPVPQQVEPDQRQFFILALSARSKEALEALLEKYGKFIENTKLTLADICYTANVGRNHFRHRVAIVANSVDGLLSKLRKKEFIRGEANGTEAFEINGKSPEEVAAAYVNGALIDWLSYGPRRQKVVLPTYPFQQKRYWAEVSPAQPGADLQPEPPVVVAGELSVALQDAQDKKRIITEHIVKYLKVILKLPEEHRLDVKQGFFEMGMDSLMAVEIVNMLQRSVGDRCAIDHTSAFDCPNIERLTAYMVKLLGYDEKTVQADPIQAEVSKMSLDELLGELGERNDD